MSRRMRLIWHKLWLIPLVGATADVVASEAAKVGGVTVPISWLFSAIGVAGMLGAAVARAYSVPLIPEGLETPDESLTRRSRVLGERLGATPVRVFVSDLPKLRGKVDTFLDGHDLFVSKRVAELPEGERDFVLARALVEHGTWSKANKLGGLIVMLMMNGLVAVILVNCIVTKDAGLLMFSAPACFIFLIGTMEMLLKRSRFWEPSRHAYDKAAAAAIGDISVSLRAERFMDHRISKARRDRYETEMAEWWRDTGQTAVEASEWYQKERGLAAKGE